MFTLGPIGFATPALLLALVALPALWWLLRAVPPAPVIRRFPGVALLIGLTDETTETDKTPWWLLLLRAVAVAALIVGFSGPVLNPQAARDGSGPLLIALDASWASAADWQRRQARVEDLLAEAQRASRPVAVVALTDLPSGETPFRAAEFWAERVPGLVPAPFTAQSAQLADWLETLPDAFDTYWLSDGLAHDYRNALTAAFQARGTLTAFETSRAPLALAPPALREGVIYLTAHRPAGLPAQEIEITATGRDPAGVERMLARGTTSFEADATTATLDFTLQPELRNRITRFQIAGERSAGAVALTDDALQRRKVALLAGRDGREGLDLLSPFFYLRQALEPVAELIESPSVDDLLLTAPDVLILVDVAQLGELETAQILDFVNDGGLLLRFAGPRLAASDVARTDEDPLLPVRLRIGGRTVGGAMSWGEPRRLREFGQDSPFAGLSIPQEVTISAQVLAQPDPTLGERTIASLADGTPLVTRKFSGDGQVVLIHTTANAEWSTLPISGLFVDMLERLAVSTRPAAPTSEALLTTQWQPERALDGFGQVVDASTRPVVAGATLAAARFGPDLPPGVYRSAIGTLALNIGQDEMDLRPAIWPASVVVERDTIREERDLTAIFLTLGLGALMIDILAALWVSGRLRGATAVLALAAFALHSPPAQAQSDDRLALQATAEMVLAHVLTGDARVDDMASAGLLGLGRTLFARTSVEPGAPIGVDLERDELTFFPFLYWPITETTPIPSDAAYAKLNRYLRGGGMIMFDTRDAELAGLTRTTPEARRLQAIARPLDIPPLEPVPEDHVLTRTFYLLQEFPGRFSGRDVWVEAAPPDAEITEGMPFRNLNDGVTPVIIGGHDWASAWAVDDAGRPLVRLGMGVTGEQQREMAYRFGINLITHVLTGNYKSDQVHVPALLERLGQ
ncbi:putative membrane protein (TIGR02226 family) [Roseinatronobacter thiooxidans]|uniref:Putative membrane protein (TIGR02226 family) n=1 Tax=Roseinatronobacter thiooxidans TaxID=121821 RepID=A0A2W7QIN8_9RHOB|nr:DUF4159 domain-containing protein [Roseinatronobacter thiooxidans]PZX47196.1 putative membrane protein (TIGR02226 family) [Roseinatronobacter thiooxidans]